MRNLGPRLELAIKRLAGRSLLPKSRAQTGISTLKYSGWILEARVRIELTIEVLQTSALPLGYRA
jgi:hypothetical protein